MSAPAVELLAAILAGQPRLTDAACRQHVALFDRAADGDQLAAQEATEVCGTCPVAQSCADWLTRAHPQRPPPGVWAARFTPPSTQRKRKPS